MLGWTRSVTSHDHVGNEDICDRYEVAKIVEKLRETHLRWYDHVICANDNSLAKSDLSIEIDGKGPKARSKQRWLDSLDGDLKASRPHPDQAYTKQNCTIDQGQADSPSEWNKF